MELLRESFLKTYANIPIGLRDQIILILPEYGPVSWLAAYLEVKNKSDFSDVILNELSELDLI